MYRRSETTKNGICREEISCMTNIGFLPRFFLLLFLLFIVVSSSYCEETNKVQGSVWCAGDLGTCNEYMSTEMNVVANDLGLSSGIKSIAVYSQPLHGRITVLENFNLIYYPDNGFIGEDEFEYMLCVNDGSCGVASVVINVIEYDFKPKAVNDSIEMIYGLSDGMRFDILQNDIDAYDEPFSITIITQPNNGSASINEDNTLSPSFDYDFIGNDSLQYRMCDAEGDCDTAWVFCEILNGDINNLFIPNALSPNGDGVNDMFRLPQLMSDVQMRITIFTQWGQVVYQNENYLNNWDGKGNLGVFNGKDLESGTYYYVLIIGDDRPPIKNYIYLSR